MKASTSIYNILCVDSSVVLFHAESNFLTLNENEHLKQQKLLNLNILCTNCSVRTFDFLLVILSEFFINSNIFSEFVMFTHRIMLKICSSLIFEWKGSETWESDSTIEFGTLKYFPAIDYTCKQKCILIVIKIFPCRQSYISVYRLQRWQKYLQLNTTFLLNSTKR